MSGWRKKQIGELQVKEHCDLLLEALVGPALVERWWASPNAAFDGIPPREVGIERVHSYLLSHAYGGEYF